MMKKVILLFMLALLVACGGVDSKEADRLDVVVPTRTTMPPPPSVEPPPTPPDVLDTAVEGPLREFVIEARRFEFLPSEIIVNKGDRVRLLVTSVDVDHGIEIIRYGINERLPKGKEMVIEFTADQKGEFGIDCSVFCGHGHAEMKGVLKVK